jgi:hypothetical protein
VNKEEGYNNNCLDFSNVEMRIVNHPRLGAQVEGGTTHTNQIYNILEMVYQRTIVILMQARHLELNV